MVAGARCDVKVVDCVSRGETTVVIGEELVVTSAKNIDFDERGKGECGSDRQYGRCSKEVSVVSSEAQS